MIYTPPCSQQKAVLKGGKKIGKEWERIEELEETFLQYYRKRGSASYIVREVREVRERERDTERERKERERERERDGSDVTIVVLKLAMSLRFPLPKIRTIGELTFLLIAIDRNGFCRMKEEGQIYKTCCLRFLLFA